MARGPKKHLKRINAPSSYMLDKLSGVFAPKMSSGPHNSKEAMPIAVLLRNRLKLALNYNECKVICALRVVEVDGKIRPSHKYPIGFMDVISLKKTNDHYRILFDTKGRLQALKISHEESNWKLLKIVKILKGSNGVTVGVSHDGRSIRYLSPEVRVGDSLKWLIKEGKVDYGEKGSNILHPSNNSLIYITGGNNIGRVGQIQHITKLPGMGKSMVTVKDHNSKQGDLKSGGGNVFSTLIGNIFVIGHGGSAGVGSKYISLLKSEGIRLDIVEDRKKRMGLVK